MRWDDSELQAPQRALRYCTTAVATPVPRLCAGGEWWHRVAATGCFKPPFIASGVLSRTTAATQQATFSCSKALGSADFGVEPAWITH